MYVSWISMSPLPLVSGGVHFLDHASSGSKQASIRAIPDRTLLQIFVQVSAPLNATDANPINLFL